MAVHLYALLLGHSHQLRDVDERLRGVDIVDPERTPGVLTTLFGYTSGADVYVARASRAFIWERVKGEG